MARTQARAHLEAGRMLGRYRVDKFWGDIGEWRDKFGFEEGNLRFPREARQYGRFEGKNVINSAASSHNGALFLLSCAVGSNAVQSGHATRAALNTLDTTSCAIGVGDGGGTVPTPTTSDVDLVGTTNTAYIAATSVSVALNVLTIVTTFGSTQAGFAWRELIAGNFGNATNYFASGSNLAAQSITLYTMLSHLGQNMGTKPASGASWQVTYTLTLT